MKLCPICLENDTRQKACSSCYSNIVKEGYSIPKTLRLLAFLIEEKESTLSFAQMERKDA